MANGPQDLKDRLDAINKRTNAEIRLNEVLGQRTNLVASELKGFAEQREQLERQLTILTNITAAQEELDKMTDEEQKKNKERVALLEKFKGLTEKQIEAEKKRLKIQYDYVKAREKEREVGLAISQNLLQSVGVSNQWKNTTMGIAVAAKQTGASFAEIAKNAMRATFSAETLDNVIGSTLMKITESTKSLILAVDSSMASFNRMFGTAGRLNSEMFQLSINANQSGILFSENMEIMQGLAGTFDMFNVISTAARKSLTETAQQMYIFGVESQTSGKLFNVLAKSLGEGSSQIQQTATGIMEFALSIGAAPEEMVQSFTKLIPEFVRYGTRAKDVFGAVAKQAKALGTEIETLIGISQKFDTFEDAGTTAGKLMGILGQPVDVMGLMEMDPEEKIRSIIGMIEESGMQAELLNNKFGLLAIGDVLGISADEAAKLVRVGISGYNELLAKQKQEAINEEKRAEQLKAAQSIVQKFQQMIQEFAIENEDAILGLIDGIKGFLQGIIDVAGYLKGAFLPTILGVLFALKIFAMRWTAVSKGAAASNAALKGAGSAAAFAGVKMALVGGAIALASIGLVALIGSLKDLTGEQLEKVAIGFGVIAGSVLLLAGAMALLAKSTTLGIIAFGAIALGLAAIAFSLQLIKTEDLIAVGNVFAGLGALAMAGGSAGNVSSAMDVVLDKVDNMKSDTLDKFKAAAGSKTNANFSPNLVGGGGGKQQVVLELKLDQEQTRFINGYIRKASGRKESIGG